MEESKIYKRPDEQLKSFEKCVNAAAKDLCLEDVSLLSRRGTLLDLARKRVAEGGCTFKKGHSRSKVYGKSVSDAPKRPKYDESMREERIQLIEEELADVTRILQFKEKRLSQHEVEKKYRSCEQVTEEIMTFKKRKHELEAERSIIVKKARRAKLRIRRKVADNVSDTLDMAPSSPSPSRSVTPQLPSSSMNSSVTLSADSDSDTEAVEPHF